MNCFSLDIRGRRVGFTVANVPLSRQDGLLMLDLGHLEGEQVPSKVVMHDHLIEGERIFQVKLDKWGQGSDYSPLLTLPDPSDTCSEVLVLLRSGAHRDGSSSKVKLSPGIKALALGSIAHDHTAGEFDDGQEPRLHFHLLKVPEGGRISIQGEVVQQVEEPADFGTKLVDVARKRSVVFRNHGGVVSSEADVWDVESLDLLVTQIEDHEDRVLLGSDEKPASHHGPAHPLERTSFYHLSDIGAEEEVQGSSV